jgi:predicted acetyltransferase
MRLIRYDSVNEAEYMDYAREWESSGETIVPGSSDRKGRTFGEMLSWWGEDSGKGRYSVGKVPSTQYFLVDDSGRVLGAIAFRHSLNERLFLHGGHIGYGVRPTERRRGYCSAMLALLLESMRDGGPERVLLTCDDDNPGSYRSIEKNGGVLENKVVFEGRLSRRYWIDIGKRPA